MASVNTPRVEVTATPQTDPTSIAPPKPEVQYQIIKVRKPDGSIVRVKRAINPDATAAGAAKPVQMSNATSSTSAVKVAPSTASSSTTAVDTGGPVRRQNDSVQQPNTSVNEAQQTAERPPMTPLAQSTAATGKLEMKQRMPAKAAAAQPPTITNTSKNDPEMKETVPIKAAAARSPATANAQTAKNTPASVTPSKSSSAPAVAAQTSSSPKGPTSPRSKASFNLVSSLGRLGMTATRAVGAFHPDWNVDELEDGDEILSDMSDSDNDLDDDDDDDDTGHGYDNDHDDHGNHSDHGESFNEKEPEHQQNGQSGHHDVGNKNSLTAPTSSEIASAYGAVQTNALQVLGSKKSAGEVARKSPEKFTTIAPTQASDYQKESPNKKGLSYSETEVRPDEKSDDVKTEKTGKNLSLRYHDWSRYIIWGVMILLPLLFLILGVLTACMHGQSRDSSYSLGVKQAINIGISAWPIIFAAVAAQSLRAYATYKVERGVRLMTLEQLVGSSSVASAFKQPFILRRIDLVTIALLCLWALSPLAGQAMVRVLGEATTQEDQSLRNLTYVNTWATNLAFDVSDHFAGGINAWDTNINRIFAASFLPDTKYYRGSDIWGSPIVPLLNESASKKDSGGWYEVSESSDYSSLFGLNLDMSFFNYNSGFEIADSISYESNLTASYLTFSCQDLRKTSWPSNTDMSTLPLSVNPGQSLLLNMTPQALNTATGVWSDGSVTLYSRVTNPATSNSSNVTYAYTTCSMSQEFVDLKMLCTGFACEFNSVKKSTTPHTRSGMRNFAQTFVTSAGGITDPKATIVERYLYDPENIDIFNDENYDLSTVPSETVAKRMALLFNSYWQIGFSPMYMTGDLDPAKNKFGVITNNTPLLPKRQIPIYDINWGWLAALEGCSVILLVAGVASVIWDTQSISPDILGFASTVARRSKYVDLPKLDGAVSGAERARAMAEVQVMMQDVKPAAPVGRIALGTAHAKAEKLRPGRLYR